MEILGDSKKRERYDKYGDLESSDGGGDTMDSASFEEQYNHWRTIFRTVTSEDIESYAKSYKNSSEEKSDVFYYYKQFSGDMTRVMMWIPLSGAADIDRYTVWIDSAIKDKTLTRYKAYAASKNKAKSAEQKYAHEAEEAEQLKAELIAKAKAGMSDASPPLMA